MKKRYSRDQLRKTILILIISSFLIISQLSSGSAYLGSFNPYPIIIDNEVVLFFDHEFVDQDTEYTKTYYIKYNTHKWSESRIFASDIPKEISWEKPIINETNIIVYSIEVWTEIEIIKSIYDFNYNKIKTEKITDSQFLLESLFNSDQYIDEMHIIYESLRILDDGYAIVIRVSGSSALTNLLGRYFVKISDKQMVNYVKLSDTTDFLHDNDIYLIMNNNYIVYSEYNNELFLMNTINGSKENLVESQVGQEIREIKSFFKSDNYLSILYIDNEENQFIMLLEFDNSSYTIANIDLSIKFKGNSFLYYKLNEHNNNTYSIDFFEYYDHKIKYWNYDSNTSIIKYISNTSLNLQSEVKLPYARGINYPIIENNSELMLFWVQKSEDNVFEIFCVRYNSLTGWSSIDQITDTNLITDDIIPYLNSTNIIFTKVVFIFIIIIFTFSIILINKKLRSKINNQSSKYQNQGNLYPKNGKK